RNFGSTATCQTNSVSGESGNKKPDTNPMTSSSQEATMDVLLKYLLHIQELYDELTSRTSDSLTILNISLPSSAVGSRNCTTRSSLNCIAVSSFVIVLTAMHLLKIII